MAALWGAPQGNGMARLTYTPFGVVLELNHSEAAQVSNHLNTVAATATTLSGLLAGFGITGAPAVIAVIVSGVFWFGSAALVGFCNQNGNGTKLTIFWVGLPFCKSL